MRLVWTFWLVIFCLVLQVSSASAGGLTAEEEAQQAEQQAAQTAPEAEPADDEHDDDQEADSDSLADPNSEPTASTEAAPSALPKPFKAVYKTRLYGIKLTATRELKQQEDGRWFLRFDIDSWVAGLKERSQFEWNDKGHAITHHYEYHRTGLAPDRHVVVAFNWDTHRVVNKLNKEEDWSMSIPDGTLDKLNATMQIRADLINGRNKLVYKVADGGKLKTFRFAIDREETIDTPVGKLDTVVVKTLRKNKKRETYTYFAKDWDHVLVRISQKEPNGDSASVDIQEGWIDGTKITGR